MWRLRLWLPAKIEPRGHVSGRGLALRVGRSPNPTLACAQFSRAFSDAYALPYTWGTLQLKGMFRLPVSHATVTEPSRFDRKLYPSLSSSTLEGFSPPLPMSERPESPSRRCLFPRHLRRASARRKIILPDSPEKSDATPGTWPCPSELQVFLDWYLVVSGFPIPNERFLRRYRSLKASGIQFGGCASRVQSGSS